MSFKVTYERLVSLTVIKLKSSEAEGFYWQLMPWIYTHDTTIYYRLDSKFDQFDNIKLVADIKNHLLSTFNSGKEF